MRILAIGGHPDDLELECFGTLAKCVARGDQVYTCSVADGCYGHYEILPDELAEIRKHEAENSAKVIGAVAIPAFSPDLNVDSTNKAQQEKMVDIIRMVNPDLIITHTANDYMKDHNETFRLVEYASFTATIPHFVTEHKNTEKPAPIYQMENYLGVNFVPDEYVDISDFIEVKKEALACHVSQHQWLKDHDDSEYVENMVAVAKFRGLQCGVKYAEGFKLYKAALRFTTERLLP